MSMKTNYQFILVFLFLTFVFDTTSRADESLSQIIFEKGINENEISGNEANTKRDIELQSVLPIAMYDTLNACILIVSRDIAFESVTYYITDKDDVVLQSSDISLPRNMEHTIQLSHFQNDVYYFVLEINGVYFKGVLEY